MLSSTKFVYVMLVVTAVLIPVNGRNVPDVKSELSEARDDCFECLRACSPGWGQCCPGMSCSIRTEFWKGAWCTHDDPFVSC